MKHELNVREMKPLTVRYTNLPLYKCSIKLALCWWARQVQPAILKIVHGAISGLPVSTKSGLHLMKLEAAFAQEWPSSCPSYFNRVRDIQKPNKAWFLLSFKLTSGSISIKLNLKFTFCNWSPPVCHIQGGMSGLDDIEHISVIVYGGQCVVFKSYILSPFSNNHMSTKWSKLFNVLD